MTVPLESFPRCAICGSPNTALRNRYKHGDTKVDLFYCLDCESLCSPTAKPWTVEWHHKVAERNRGFARKLFAELAIDKPFLLDIGCGTGTLISVATELGGGGVGFDTDASAVEAGKAEGYDLRCQLWDSTVETPVPSLITCIMVLEHLHQPIPLMKEMAIAAKKYGCPIFISVPWFNRNWWPHLSKKPVDGQFHPLRGPRIHVTHFSFKGFEKIMKRLGAQELQHVKAGWEGFLVRF